MDVQTNLQIKTRTRCNRKSYITLPLSFFCFTSYFWDSMGTPAGGACSSSSFVGGASIWFCILF